MMDTVFNHPWVSAMIAGLLLIGVVGKLMRFSFERISKWYLYASVFCVLIVMNSSLFPFIGGKDYFFRFTVELAVIALALWWAFEAPRGELMARTKNLFKRPLVIAVTVFAIAFLVASLFAYDVHAAFWSNYERGEGAFQVLHYYVFFLLLGLIMRTDDDWKRVFRSSLIAAGAMVLYGLAANLGIGSFIGPYAGGAPPASIWHRLIDGRFEGSLGNPAYVAPYLIFAMFYAGYLWIDRRRSGLNMKMASWGYGALIAVFFIFFVLAQTRGAFLGLAAGIFAFIIYMIFASRGAVRRWSSLTLLILVILGLGLYSVRNTPFVQKLPEGRLLQISLSDDSAQTRLWVWGEALQGFRDRPIFGWGPENFAPVFDKYFNSKFYVPGANNETWFDRAHSVFFDYLVETGIVGLAAYLAIFVVFLWEFVRSKRHEHESVVVRGLMIALPAAYLVQGVAIFDVLPMYINLFLFLAFSSYYFSRNYKVSQ